MYILQGMRYQLQKIELLKYDGTKMNAICLILLQKYNFSYTVE